MLSTFMVLNLFIGVVVSALHDEKGVQAPSITHLHEAEARILGELAALRTEVAALRREPIDRV